MRLIDSPSIWEKQAHSEGTWFYGDFSFCVAVWKYTVQWLLVHLPSCAVLTINPFRTFPPSQWDPSCPRQPLVHFHLSTFSGRFTSVGSHNIRPCVSGFSHIAWCVWVRSRWGMCEGFGHFHRWMVFRCGWTHLSLSLYPLCDGHLGWFPFFAY